MWLLEGQKAPDHNTIDKITVEYMMKIKNEHINKKTEFGIEFVTGKGKHKTQLQRDIEALEEYIERQTQYNHYNSLLDGHNSFSKAYMYMFRIII